jgi:2-C-methyl-D-erythritol 4-phosphate cytidylyltransferase/2-C-methyl-D-erythritol 2,4-cyclodiphosphate synthase
MRVVAAVLAAGKGVRFGSDKTQAMLARRPVWRWSFDLLSAHPQIDEVLVVANDANRDQFFGVDPSRVLLGGETRQASSRAATLAAQDRGDVILLHDAARPFLTEKVVDDVLRAVENHGAAAAAMPVADTIKQLHDGLVTTLDRDELRAMQTPQAARIPWLTEAHAHAKKEFTDEMALLESVGITPAIVEGDPLNFKITAPEDLTRARILLGSPETRTGFGYDVHAFSEEAGRELMLGGVAFPGHAPLEGHSDADVVLHAATDALLGAASLGDIGQHFPNTDPTWRGAPSRVFLAHAAELLRENGWRVLNLDLTVLAESPKIMPSAREIRTRIAETLGIDVGRVSIKATTNEGLGSIGRGEGIAAFATATISERL